MSLQLFNVPIQELASTPNSGTMFERMYRIIGDDPIAQRFFAGQLSQQEWIDFLELNRTRLEQANIPVNDVDFSKRYPHCAARFAETTYQRPELENLLPSLDSHWQAEAFEIAQVLTQQYEHQGRTTYIYPEEGYLIYTLAKAFRAKRAIFLGSYYGYWVAWALPAIIAEGGSVVLIDPDSQCCELAQLNLSKLYPEASIEIVCTTGQDYLSNYSTAEQGAFDFVVLDAELPNDYPDEALRGKGLYYALLNAVLPHLSDPSLLVCHNILLNDKTGSQVLQSAVNQNQQELTPFLKLVNQYYQYFTEILSTEGMGVGLHQKKGLAP